MRKFLIFIMASIILASCGSAPPEETDWCWTHDFMLSDNGFNIATGQWISGVGLQTSSGDLSFSYEHDQFVTPALLYITVRKPVATTLPITITAAGIVYGISSSFSVDLNTDYETVYFLPETQGDAGTTINVTIDTGAKDLILESIRVEGFGDTPFPSNPCEDVDPYTTNTPTQTLTPIPATNTPTPTDTPTVTNTPTATSTVTGNWCFQFDAINVTYTTSDGTNDASSGFGMVSERLDNVAGTPYGAQIVAHIPVDYTTVLTDVIWDAQVVTEHTDNVFYAYSVDGGTWTYNMVDGENGYYQGSMSGQDRTVYSYIDVGFAYGYAGLSKPVDWAYTYMLSGMRLYGTGGNPIANNCAEYTTATPVATATGYPIVTNTPFNYVPTVDLTQTTATPSITPQPTWTDIASPTPYITATLVSGTHTAEQIVENEAEYELLEEQQQSNNAIQNLLQDILEELQGSTGGSGDGETGETGTGGVDGAGDWQVGIDDSLSGIAGIFGKLGTYFDMAFTGASNLMASFYTADPQAIPGLPLCITEPLNHDICAIYYILDWTLFAPNTIGSFIVPLVLAIMNTIFIFRTLRYVLKLLRRAEDVT